MNSLDLELLELEAEVAAEELRSQLKFDVKNNSRNHSAIPFIAALEQLLNLANGTRLGHRTRVSSQCSEIIRLIGEGADVNACNDRKVAALIIAVNAWRTILEREGADIAQSPTEVVCEIITHGANPNVQDEDGFTPLHLAIFNVTDVTDAIGMNHRIIRLLVDAGARIDPPSACEPPWPKTPLVKAVEEDHVETVELLLSLGADINLSIGGTTALKADIYAGGDLFPLRVSPITSVLLENGVDLKTEQGRILASVISQVPESVERFLRECYGDPEAEHIIKEGIDPGEELEAHSEPISAPFLAIFSVDQDERAHERQVEELCTACRTFEESAIYRQWFFHSADSDSIYRSISAGCSMCQLIKDCLPISFGEVSLYYYSALSEADTLSKHYFERIIVRGQLCDDFHYGELRLAIVDDKTSSILSRANGLEDHTTDSEPAFQLASHWVRTCLNSHGSACHVSDQLPLLPTRVIDVGPSDGSDQPRLLISEGQRGHYATLSYCWGDKANISTISSTLEAFKTSIPFALIPKTIREAVITTRKLGIKYLWVDTLCILQDSVDDWLREAKNIASVYRNSLLTIAAADSADSEGGLFRERNRLRVRPVKIAPRLVPSTLGPPESIYAFGDRQETNDGFRRESRLDERGWVLQEQLLSPRTLNFSSQELYWDCPGLSASESYPAGIPRDHDHNFERRYFTELKMRILAANLPVDRERVHMLWQRMVVLYSKRKLSRQTDKLVALAGAANQVSIALNDKLLAGLWIKWLWRDLLWWVDRPKDSPILSIESLENIEDSKMRAPATPRKTRIANFSKRTSGTSTHTSVPVPKEFEAPSWSWASILGPISYDFPLATSYLRFYPCLQILSHSETILPEAKGVRGSLTIRGLLLPAIVDGHSNEWATPGWEPNTQKARRYWPPMWKKTDTLAEALIWKPDTEEVLGGDIKCLVVASSHQFIVALGLVPGGENPSEYRRVGLLYWSTHYYAVPKEVDFEVLTLV